MTALTDKWLHFLYSIYICQLPTSTNNHKEPCLWIFVERQFLGLKAKAIVSSITFPSNSDLNSFLWFPLFYKFTKNPFSMTVLGSLCMPMTGCTLQQVLMCTLRRNRVLAKLVCRYHVWHYRRVYWQLVSRQHPGLLEAAFTWQANVSALNKGQLLKRDNLLSWDFLDMSFGLRK